eukprot:TRINITY_DN44515_c0_g1_i1.p1 TRINITY_DN44515_c0_g1~~TRINITY_DN44515_c0_g1_i1.p1  ORF type:complete len:108 (+),score=6.27 TRINITY_DN44515_c0_g1_i1:188-511(+)
MAESLSPCATVSILLCFSDADSAASMRSVVRPSSPFFSSSSIVNAFHSSLATLALASESASFARLSCSSVSSAWTYASCVSVPRLLSSRVSNPNPCLLYTSPSPRDS